MFWVHASDATRFKQAYRSIASKLNLPTRDDPNVDTTQLVYDWLCNAKHVPWLMILDSADDPSIFTQQYSPVTGDISGANSELLARYLPDTPHGSILVTSRFDLAGIAVVGSPDLLVKIGPMTKESSMELLMTKISAAKVDEPNKARAPELIDML